MFRLTAATLALGLALPGAAFAQSAVPAIPETPAAPAAPAPAAPATPATPAAPATPPAAATPATPPAAAPASPPTAITPPATSGDRVARGQEYVLARPYALTQDCGAGPVSIRVVQNPRLGTISQRPEGITVRQGGQATNVTRCDGRTVQGIAIVYRAGQEAGTDNFSYEITLGPRGSSQARTFRRTIQVQ